MSPGEIMWRGRKLIWQVWAKGRYKVWAKKFQESVVSSTRLVDMMQPVYFYGVSEKARCDYPDLWRDPMICLAKECLSHRWPLFSLGWVDLGETVNFNMEYKQRLSLPLEFAPWMDYRDTGTHGDFKYFWEVSRLQHLVPLAKAYYLTGEKRYACEVESQLNGFFEQCPYLHGVAWIMPMEVGIRLISLCWIVALMQDYLQAKPMLCGRLEQMVLSHTEYVAKNYAAYSSANNHLIGEAAGVFVASICFSGLEGMSQKGEEAFAILVREARCQHHPDGVNKEQGMHYQMFCFELLLLAGLLGRQNGMDFPREYWDTLEKSAVFMAAMAHSDGQWRHIGDSDDGHGLIVGGERQELDSLLTVASVFFRRSDLVRHSESYDEKAYWLLGPESRCERNGLLSAKGRGVLPCKFPYGGYYVLGMEIPVSVRIVADCGPLGFQSIAAHGHADCLSFTLDVQGKSILIDPGTYTYVANNSYRNYFRSTVGHNTVEVDGKDQSVMAGPFLWSMHAVPCVEEWVSDSYRDRLVARHNGYQRLKDPVIHRRNIELDKSKAKIYIIDEIHAYGSHVVRIGFHLASKCQVNRLDESRYQIRNEHTMVLLEMDANTTVELVYGNVNPMGGWVSYRYDQIVPTYSIYAVSTITQRSTFQTVVHLTSE